MTTTPSIETVSRSIRMASTAAPSAPSLSPRPIHLALASAAYSVVRTSSIARLRSGPARLTPSGGAPTSTRASIGRGRYYAPPVGVGRREARPAKSERPKLDHARWLARLGVDRLAQIAGNQQAGGGDQADEVADPEADVHAVTRPAEDDSVAEDQHQGGDPDDHRHLARLPGEAVAASDDPREDEGGGAGEHEQHVEAAEHLPGIRRVALAGPRDRRVRILVAGREPRQPERDEQHNGGAHAEVLARRQPGEIEVAAPPPGARGLHQAWNLHRYGGASKPWRDRSRVGSPQLPDGRRRGWRSPRSSRWSGARRRAPTARCTRRSTRPAGRCATSRRWTWSRRASAAKISTSGAPWCGSPSWWSESGSNGALM